MRHYRLYFMSSSGRHIDRFEAIEADDDKGAIEVAKLYRGQYSLELWWRGRCVKVFAVRPRGHPPPRNER